MQEFIFWGIWLLIPLLVDIISGVAAIFIALIEHFKKRKEKVLEYYPHVTLLVPVYNSEKTLEGCIEAIANQDYPIKNIQVLLIDNGSKDSSKDIYYRLQSKYKGLRLWWLDSSQGKAKALNKGLYMAEGKYIINIDSDGILDRKAIFNLVYKFEQDSDIYALTGVVLTNFQDIKETKNQYLKIYQKCELFEYCEAFLIGRGFQSKTNTMFTLSGACSAFRKDAVLRTQLYNSETLGEDTHMTSQIRIFLNGKVKLCEDAFFFVDPIESVDKLYIQRQRWQRGEIEVSTLFLDKNKKRGLFNILKYNMLIDHTLVFPRLIWMFAMIYLLFIEYPLKLVVGANIIMYLVYAGNSLLQFLVGKLYLKTQKDTKKFMNRNFLIVFLLPLYRMLIFIMRVAGIINAKEKNAKWNTKTFSEEKVLISESVKKKNKMFYKIRSWMNSEI